MFPHCPKNYEADLLSRKKTSKTIQSGTAYKAEAVRIRRDVLKLSNFRQFTKYQEILILDTEYRSRLTADKVTLFGLRPPELRFVTSLEYYFQWFVFNERKADSQEKPLRSRKISYYKLW